MPFDTQVTCFLRKLGAAPELLPHQKRVVDKVTNSNHGLVVYHSVGTGKGISLLSTIKASEQPGMVLPPAALQENIHKELAKFTDKDKPDVRVSSQQRAATQGLPAHAEGSILGVDEAAKARDPNSKLHKVLAKSKAKKLLMTGSGVYNHPVDLANLVNLAANKQILPNSKEEFEKKYVGYEKVQPNFLQRIAGLSEGEKPVLKDDPQLKKILKEYVDYHATKSDNADFPTIKEEEKIVPMSRGQTDIYNTIMGKAPLWTRMKVKAGLPPNRKELAKLKSFLTGPRQVSNSTQGFSPIGVAESAKAEAAFKSLQDAIAKNPKHKAVVYSNFIENGLADYKKHLDAHGIPYGEFSGDVPDAQRQKYVQDYNKDKLRALLISSAGAEGLDLKGTRQVQLLEPHFNEEKERQIIGRARRYKSHAHLPEDQRTVNVERYMARPQGGFMDKLIGGGAVHGVDEYLRDIAKSKSSLNDQMLEMLRNQHKRNIFGL
jgi:hypothetical protein